MNIYCLRTNEPFSIRTYHSLPAYGQWYRTESLLCVYCRKGELRMSIDSREYILKPYSIATCISGVLFHFDESSRDMEIVLMILSNEFLSDIRIPYPACLMLFFKQHPCLVLREEQTAGIEMTVHFIERTYKDGNNRFRLSIARLHMENYILEICNGIERLYPLVFNRSTSNEEHLCVRFIRLVQKNYMSRYALTFYAAELQISERYLCRIVRTITGATPRDIINCYIIEESKILLRYTKISLQRISMIFGFRNGAVFSRLFRRETGMLPHSYRSEYIP